MNELKVGDLVLAENGACFYVAEIIGFTQQGARYKGKGGYWWYNTQNTEATLEETLASVTAADYEDWNYEGVDDGRFAEEEPLTDWHWAIIERINSLAGINWEE